MIQWLTYLVMPFQQQERLRREGMTVIPWRTRWLNIWPLLIWLIPLPSFLKALIIRVSSLRERWMPISGFASRWMISLACAIPLKDSHPVPPMLSAVMSQDVISSHKEVHAFASLMVVVGDALLRTAPRELEIATSALLMVEDVDALLITAASPRWGVHISALLMEAVASAAPKGAPSQLSLPHPSVWCMEVERSVANKGVPKSLEVKLISVPLMEVVCDVRRMAVAALPSLSISTVVLI
jgi:hypothetical protein